MVNFDANYIGVSMHTVVRHPAICPSDPTTYDYSQSTGNLGNFVYAWSMITSSNDCGLTVGHCGWMQSGYFRSIGQSKVHFSQIWNYQQWGGIPQNKLGSVVVTNEVHQYWQQYAPDVTGDYHSNVDTTRFINTAPGLLTHNWTGYSQQYANETRYRASDVPGSSGSHAPLFNLQVQPPGGGAFVNIPSPFLTTANNNLARWHVSPTSATSFDLWTDPI